MSNSLTIVIPNRNRDLEIVKRSLGSIVSQLNDAIRLVIVDYGSVLSYQVQLELLVKSFDQVELILCPTQEQLWNKSRCINIVLQSCATTHFMVSDMDMIWHSQFLANQIESFSQKESIYFSVGVMTQEESTLDKSFEDYAIKFQTNNEATGITVFPSAHLKFINGFDEFYHGWGSEDTDVHVRLKNAGYIVRFCESEILFKHQWHAKSYRTKESTSPFHPYLERINQSYLLLTQESKKIKANGNGSWGKTCNNKVYDKLSEPTLRLKRYATEHDVQALVNALIGMDSENVVEVQIKKHPESKSLKKLVKEGLGKKTLRFISLDRANETLLEALILNHHSCAYSYSYDRTASLIIFRIKLGS
ncbi:glycosyltransferase [Nonlabens sp. Ci31]|uniref:glycosyltransferase family 2 protein n=1 Tax=Nonlabens sp. Ci31 TaxID=2608253 RepID=UPI001463555C|nr:galactosyltransferase-related protein [Nonlabens sp. Ci31]QJP32988.1 glycosyltransferase [Nonlabens sp. Ci31]